MFTIKSFVSVSNVFFYYFICVKLQMLYPFQKRLGFNSRNCSYHSTFALIVFAALLKTT